MCWPVPHLILWLPYIHRASSSCTPLPCRPGGHSSYRLAAGSRAHGGEPAFAADQPPFTRRHVGLQRRAASAPAQWPGCSNLCLPPGDQPLPIRPSAMPQVNLLGDAFGCIIVDDLVQRRSHGGGAGGSGGGGKQQVPYVQLTSVLQ